MIIKGTLKQNRNWIAKNPIAIMWVCIQAMAYFGKYLQSKKAFKCLFLFETLFMVLGDGLTG